jgi:ferric-dicitrate binding protein FerR (iron transport regulator)
VVRAKDQFPPAEPPTRPDHEPIRDKSAQYRRETEQFLAARLRSSRRRRSLALVAIIAFIIGAAIAITVMRRWNGAPTTRGWRSGG